MDAFSKGASGSWEPGEWLYEAQDADSEVDKFFSL